MTTSKDSIDSTDFTDSLDFFMSQETQEILKKHYMKKGASSVSSVFSATPDFMPQSIAAIFDVDGTLLAGASLEVRFVKYLWRYGELRVSDIVRQAAGAFRTACAGQSVRRANKAYLRGKNLAHYQRLAADFFEQHIKLHLLPRAIERLRWHQQQGHDIVLVSGSLDFLLAPLARYLNASIFIGTKIKTEAEILRGEIIGTQPYSRAKVAVFQALQQFRNFDLARSFAYGNHFSDRHLLALTGNPVAANPDYRLRNFAMRNHWMIEEFGQEQRGKAAPRKIYA